MCRSVCTCAWQNKFTCVQNFQEARDISQISHLGRCSYGCLIQATMENWAMLIKLGQFEINPQTCELPHSPQYIRSCLRSDVHPHFFFAKRTTLSELFPSPQFCLPLTNSQKNVQSIQFSRSQLYTSQFYYVQSSVILICKL